MQTLLLLVGSDVLEKPAWLRRKLLKKQSLKKGKPFEDARGDRTDWKKINKSANVRRWLVYFYDLENFYFYTRRNLAVIQSCSNMRCCASVAHAYIGVITAHGHLLLIYSLRLYNVYNGYSFLLFWEEKQIINNSEYNILLLPLFSPWVSSLVVSGKL